MDSEERFTALERKVDKIYESVEKTRMYFKWTMIISIAVIILPILAAIIIIPILSRAIEPIISLY